MAGGQTSDVESILKAYQTEYSFFQMIKKKIFTHDEDESHKFFRFQEYTMERIIDNIMIKIVQVPNSNRICVDERRWNPVQVGRRSCLLRQGCHVFLLYLCSSSDPRTNSKDIIIIRRLRK